MDDEFCELCAGESDEFLDLQETAFGMVCRECRDLMWGKAEDAESRT